MKLIFNELQTTAILLFRMTVYTPLKYILLFIIAVTTLASYGNNTWVEILKQGLPIIFSAAIFILIYRELWSNRSKLNFVGAIYFQSGILTYLRALGIVVITISLGIIFYLNVPEFLKWGWGSLVFGDSGNVALQPLDTASQVGQKVSELQGNSFDYRWLFMGLVWMTFMLILPFWAEAEEKIFRKGIHSWKGMAINSLKFGLVHLIMGIPICWALMLSVPGFLFACRYKYAYHRHLNKFKNEIHAQDAGVRASTADHTIYNAILITLSVTILLLVE